MGERFNLLPVSASEADRLHVLMADWQILADLAMADLVLWMPTKDDRFVAVAQCRPATGQTVHLDDVVGKHASPMRRERLRQTYAEGKIISADSPRWAGTYSVMETFIPVVVDGHTCAVMSRESGSGLSRIANMQAQWSASAADLLCQMMTRGEYPYDVAPTVGTLGAPRVSDGIMLVDGEGRLSEISPNAFSCLRRIGLPQDLKGQVLAETITDLISKEADPVEETLAVVVMGRASWVTEVETRLGTITLRALPLTNGKQRLGAILLCRDVTEMRRREREMMSKDATIREIHHRVKNNLQTVHALLRMQTRRSDNPEVKSALQEAGRRVGTIAKVHDVLSQTLDETVDFDKLAKEVLALAASMASFEGDATAKIEGSFGTVGADAASALSVVLSELVTNAVEHGLEGERGTILVRANRDGAKLHVEVINDGKSIPEGATMTGLGTRIVQTLVRGELGDAVEWSNLPHGGTVATVNAVVDDV